AHVARCITLAPRVAILRSAFVPLVIPFSPANKSLSIPRAGSRNLPAVTAAPKLLAPRRKLSWTVAGGAGPGFTHPRSAPAATDGLKFPHPTQTRTLRRTRARNGGPAPVR